MDFPFQYQIADTHGSVEACGVSFSYKYNAEKNALQLFRNESGCKTLNITLPEKIRDNPLLFIHQLEKATKIKALTLSNNETLKLCQTIVPDKLSAIAKSISKLALNSYDLSMGQTEKFSRLIRRSYNLKEFEISRVNYDSGAPDYYRAKIVSCRDHCVIVREDRLDTVVKNLGEKILSDLITHEYSSRGNDCSQQLLRLAVRLNVMAKILNDNFYPEKFIILNDSNRQNMAS
ncbi:MAG: hypothetical protein ACK4VI_02495 [Alphaproteobacteria bacterium]